METIGNLVIKFLIPDSSTQSMSPSTTITSGHHFIQDSSPTDHLSPQNHHQHHLSGSTLILGPTHSPFELHQQQPNHHDPSPPEIGSTTMWEDIASSIKKLDPDHADVLLVASGSSSSGNVLVPTNTSMAQHSVTQQNHFTTIGGEHPQMIVTSVQGDSHLMQDQQQDCNSYVITSLPNDNNGAPICLLPSNQNVNHSGHMGGPNLLSGGEISDNNCNITVSSMAQTSATTNAFTSMSFDSSTTVSNHGGIHSFEYDPTQRDSKEGILTMDSVNLSPNSDPRSHITLQQDGRHCHQQHDINQNPSNPSAITVSSPVSSQLSYQQINPILDNQSSHSHHQQQHHPPHSNQHHVQLQPSNANLSNHR